MGASARDAGDERHLRHPRRDRRPSARRADSPTGPTFFSALYGSGISPVQLPQKAAIATHQGQTAGPQVSLMLTCGDAMLDEEEIARRVRIQSTDQMIDAAIVAVISVAIEHERVGSPVDAIIAALARITPNARKLTGAKAQSSRSPAYPVPKGRKTAWP